MKEFKIQNTKFKNSLADTVVAAAGEVIEEESSLTVGFEGGGVEVEALGDRIGDDGKALAEFVDKAENQIPVGERKARSRRVQG